jgi:hypothetical protein
MKQQLKPVIIICEGQSEVAYIQELNRLLAENQIGLVLTPQNASGGYFSNVSTRYRNEKKRNPRSEIIIWVDHDIYGRNDHGTRTAYENKPQGIPDFYFNHQNFEDFFILHLSDEIIKAWQICCLQHNHFSQPLYAKDYMSLYHSHVLKDYTKGEIPFELSMEHIRRLCANNIAEKVPFSSDFASWLHGQLSEHL